MAADHYRLVLMTMLNEGYDALDVREVDIKPTKETSVAFQSESGFLLVLKLQRDGDFEEIDHELVKKVWDCLRHEKMPSNGTLEFQYKYIDLKDRGLDEIKSLA
jgi:hypothetical protein